MLAACQKNGAKMAVGCTRRWDGYWNTARELIDSGELGQVWQVNGYGRAGISINGSHLIDLVRYLAGGHVKWVFGEMESDEKAAGDEDLMGNGYRLTPIAPPGRQPGRFTVGRPQSLHPLGGYVAGRPAPGTQA